MDALDPIDCTRCKRHVPVDDPHRPEWIKSFVHAPLQPRPLLGERPVPWLIEGDMDRPGSVTALLCPDCLELLRGWMYLGQAAPAVDDDAVPLGRRQVVVSRASAR